MQRDPMQEQNDETPKGERRRHGGVEIIEGLHPQVRLAASHTISPPPRQVILATAANERPASSPALKLALAIDFDLEARSKAARSPQHSVGMEIRVDPRRRRGERPLCSIQCTSTQHIRDD